MDESDNPYRSPRSPALEAWDARGCYRRGRHVYVPVDGDLPAVCYCCGEAAAEVRRVRYRYYGNSRWRWLDLGILLLPWTMGILLQEWGVWLLLLWLVYVVLCGWLRFRYSEYMTVSRMRCHRHRMQHYGRVAAVLILPVMCLAWIFAMPRHGFTDFLLPWLILALLGVGSWHGRTQLRLVRIRKGYGVFGGCGRGLLKRLPELK